MNIQPNKPLALAVLRARNGEIPGFEDFYLLTCRNTLADIQASIPEEDKVYQVFRAVYTAVWQRRSNLPETGIVRPWIRVLIREKARTELGVTIEEFPSEISADPVRDYDERLAAELVKIEDGLQLISLPDSITGRKSRGSLPVAVVKFMLGCAAIGISLFLAAGILRSTGLSIRQLKQDLQETEAEETTEAAVEETQEAALPQEEQNGWTETREGWRYRMEDGSWLESEWFEENDRLYYFDDLGYAVTEPRRFGNQNVIFGSDGAVTEITRSYGHEKNQTVLSLQMRNNGHEEDAEYIVDDSIVLDDDWIYYLFDEDGNGGLPLLLRVRRDSDSIEHISDRVTGYLVLAKSVWYCTDHQILRFDKGQEGAAVGSGYTVTEEEDGWYLRDHYGRAVSGVGGYESISGRVYRVEEGLVKSVREDVQNIGSYSFRTKEAGKSPAIMLGDGREYLRQGEAVDALAVLGETLYYSVLMTGGEEPQSQIWRVDVYTGASKAVSGLFPGRIRAMLPFGDHDSILMEYRPGASDAAYGRLAILTGGNAYLVEDAEARKGGYDSGNDQLNPVWFDGDTISAYWRDCDSTTASDGTVQVLDSRTLTLSAWETSKLGSGGAYGDGPVFFADGGAYETLAADPARTSAGDEESGESESSEETNGESPESQESGGGTAAHSETSPAPPSATQAAPTEAAPTAAPTEASPAPPAATQPAPTEAAPAPQTETQPAPAEAPPAPTVQAQPAPAEAGPGGPGDAGQQEAAPAGPAAGGMETVAPIPMP